MLRACSLLLLTLTLAGAATAQTPIRLGQPLEGRLEPTDAHLENGAHYDLYTFLSEADGTVTVQLQADAFDPYLYAGTGLGNAWQEMASDDDGGLGLNSRLVLQVRAGQTVVLRAAGLVEDATGSYTLSVQAGDVGGDDPVEAPVLEPAEIDPARIQPIRVDEAATGTVAAGEDALFRFTPQGGGVYTLVIDTADFDPMLELGTLTGTTFTPTATDDDAGSGLNPLLVFSADDATPVVVRVRGFGDHAGRFGLRVRAGDLAAQYADPEAVPDSNPEVPVEVDPATVLPISTDAPVIGTVETEAVRLFRFMPPAAGPYTVVVDTADFDPMLQVGTLTGMTFTPTAIDDDAGAGYNPLLVVEASAGTPVHVRVLGFDGGAGAFGLRVLAGDQSAAFTDPEEGGDGPVLDFSAAQPVPLGSTRRTFGATALPLEWDAQRVFDLLRFDAPRAGRYTLVTASAAFDPSLEVGRADANNRFLSEGFDEDAGVGLTAALVIDLEAGPYYLRVLSDTLRGGAYTLEIREGDLGAEVIEANLPDQVDLRRAVAVQMEQTVTGVLASTDPIDLPWDSATDLYTFEATAGQTITFEVHSTSDLDPYLEVGAVTGDVFTQLTLDDDSGEGLDAMIRFTFERAGRYVIRVSAINKTLGSYTLRVGS